MYPHYFPMLALGTYARAVWGEDWKRMQPERRSVWPRIVSPHAPTSARSHRGTSTSQSSQVAAGEPS